MAPNRVTCEETPDAALPDAVWGSSPCGIFGYSHLTGGYAGSHAEYIRVPFADTGAVEVPDRIRDSQALFCADALATGYFGADLCDLRGGEVVAVWGAGGVGLSAVSSALLKGAERVIAIDRIPARLKLAQERAGAGEALDFKKVDVVEALEELTGGRGPDACIDAVGMEAQAPGIQGAYDRVKQAARLESERPYVLRQAVQACRKGGTLVVLGVYGGFVDKFPVGALMNKGLQLRTGQVHAQRYIPRLLDHVQRGELDPSTSPPTRWVWSRRRRPTRGSRRRTATACVSCSARTAARREHLDATSERPLRPLA